MNFGSCDRRSFLASGALAFAGACLSGCQSCKPSCGGRRRYSLNPPTVRGYGLGFRRQVELAVAAGFDGLESWLRDVHAARADGSFADAVKFARDAGLRFVNGIAFGTWADADPAKRVNPWLSIELFNPNYWKTTPLETMRTALAKMRGVAS